MKKIPVFVKNFRVLEQKHPQLAQLVSRDHPEIVKYHVFDAKNGSKTLAIESGGKMFQIHSKYDPEKEAMQQILSKNFLNPKLAMILGLGLGYHIRAALKHFGESNYSIVVVEKDPNAFRTAIQHVDMSDLFEMEKIRWVIGVKEDDAYATMFDLIKGSSMNFQLFLKTLVVFDHPVLTQLHGEYHCLMLKMFREAANNVIINYGNCPEDSLMGVRNIMANLGTILKSPGIQDLFGAFEGVPGIIVSTGPSLDRNIHDLVGVEDRCVMICADSALWPLVRKGITPHIFATLERVIETVRTYDTIPEDIMKQVYMGATPVIRPEGYAAWKGPNIIVYRDFAHFRWIDIPKGTLKVGLSCSNMAFKMLEAFGCDPIILVGQDCSFESIEKTHASGTRGRLIDPLKPEQLYKIKGNYQDWVYTDMFFDLFRKGFVTDIAKYKGKVYNCTAGGAYIEGTTLMPLREAIDKFCTKPVNARKVIAERLKYPTPDEIQTNWKKLYHTIKSTITEVQAVIDFCDKGVKKVEDFEQELAAGGFFETEDFLKRFPDQRLDEVFNELTQARAKIVMFGKYFELYLMHIVQMIIIRYEIDFNELPSLCPDLKRCKLQAIRMMKRWFPTIRDVCKISLNLLEESFVNLKNEFGEPS